MLDSGWADAAADGRLRVSLIVPKMASARVRRNAHASLETACDECSRAHFLTGSV